MRWRLDQQTALITGASRGIGLACTRELLSFGADVLMIARDELHLETIRAELAEEFPDRQVRALSADISQAEQRMEVMDWIGDLECGLNILVNNTGTNIRKATTAYSESEYRFVLETNLIAAFEMCRLCYPLLHQHMQSAIVNITSVGGLTHLRTGSPYGMSKAALEQMTRNLAVEWAEDGIRVNAVAPWYIRTPLSEQVLTDPLYLEEVISRTPMGRIGEAEEVAAAVAFLCLPAAAFITGECIAVDGGFLRNGF